MKLSFINNLGAAYPNAQVYVGILGMINGQWGYLHSDGTFQPAKAMNGNNYTDSVYFFTLDAINNMQLSGTIISGRCYIAAGNGLDIPIAPTGFQGPVFDTPGTKNYSTINDKFEFTLEPNALNCNTTCVDFCAIPYTLSLSSNPGNVVGMNVSQKDIFNAFQGTDFANLVLPGLRVLNPAKSGSFNPHYFDSYVNQGWGHYTQSNPLTLQISGGSVQGYPDANGTFNFAAQDGNHTVARPASQAVFACDGAFHPAGSGAFFTTDGQIKRQMAAALNRGVFTNSPGTWCDGSSFYQNGTSNGYSKIMHQLSVNGNSYGFAWDDVCNLYSTLIAGGANDTLTVTLHSLS